MKKVTLKITVLFLTLFVFQMKAQITEGVIYNLRNVETNQYLKSNTEDDITSAIDYAEDASLNWTFVAVPDQDYYNIVSSTRGILRAPGAGADYRMIVTAFAAPRDNSDKVFLLVPIDGGAADAPHYRFSTLSGARFIHQGTDDLDPYMTNSDAEDDRSLWAVEVSEIQPVASTQSFSIGAFSISNPINNQLTIKGATSDVSEISMYSVLGNKVLSKSMNSESGDISINVSALANGLYIVEMTSNDGQRFTKKIIKQ